MYDEDRLHALELYERMFDTARDEQSLLQLLISPTKQAVIIARAYNSRERKLHVQSQSRRDDSMADNGAVEYVAAIDQIRQIAIAQRIIAPEVTAGQFSLFEDEDMGAAFAPHYNEQPAAMPVNYAVPVAEAEKAYVPAHAAEPAPVQAEEIAGPELATPAAPVVGDPDKFMGDLSRREEDLNSQSNQQPQTETVPEVQEESPSAVDYVRKPKIFLLILFVLLAVPVTLIAVLLLLIPTVLSLGLAVSVLSSGVLVLVAAFSGFAVLADILVVLGTALVTLALGMLFLWLFVWFIGGAIVGLIRSVIELGGNWCYKEVPAV